MKAGIVPCYGLYQDDDGLRWLLEERRSISLVGLRSEDCPFKIRSERLGCPHRFDFEERANQELMDLFKKYYDKSQIIRMISPDCEPSMERAVYVTTENPIEQMMLFQLFELCSINASKTCHAKDLKNPLKIEEIARRVNNSTLGRYLITGVNSRNQELVERVLQQALMWNGRLFVAGERVPLYGLKKYVPVVPFDNAIKDFMGELSTLNHLRDIGARIVSDYLRKVA